MVMWSFVVSSFLLFYLSGISSFDWTGTWVQSADPVEIKPSCPVKNAYSCPDVNWGSHYWKWKSHVHQLKEDLNPFQCLPSSLSSLQICFIGDSLARQFYIELACDYGTDHVYETSSTQKGKLIKPIQSSLSNHLNVTLKYKFHLMVDLTQLRKNDQNIIRGCDIVILSYGAWHLGMAEHALQPLYYENIFEHTIKLMQEYSPDTLIIIRPNTAGFLNESKQHIAKYCEQSHSAPTNITSEEVKRAHFNQKVSAYNEKLYEVARRTNVMILGERKNGNESLKNSIVHLPFYLSLLHPCSYADLFHFCQPFTVSSSMYREFGRLLANNICSKYSKV